MSLKPLCSRVGRAIGPARCQSFTGSGSAESKGAVRPQPECCAISGADVQFKFEGAAVGTHELATDLNVARFQIGEQQRSGPSSTIKHVGENMCSVRGHIR